MPNLVIENKQLKERLAALEDRLANQSTPPSTPTTTTHPNEDYRNKPIQIAYGRGGKNFVFENLPVVEAFHRLVDFYDQFQRTPDRNVSKEILDDKTASGAKINQATVYCKMTYRDLHSKQIITTIREMPIWLAVDNQVQQNKQVEIISEAEYQAWYDDMVMKERKTNRDFQRALQQRKLDQAVNAQLVKEASGVTSE